MSQIKLVLLRYVSLLIQNTKQYRAKEHVADNA